MIFTTQLLNEIKKNQATWIKFSYTVKVKFLNKIVSVNRHVLNFRPTLNIQYLSTNALYVFIFQVLEFYGKSFVKKRWREINWSALMKNNSFSSILFTFNSLYGQLQNVQWYTGGWIVWFGVLILKFMRSNYLIFNIYYLICRLVSPIY